MYDYGTSCHGWFQEEQLCNQHIYGQETPPAYDLGRITTPLMLVTGTRDKLSDTQVNGGVQPPSPPPPPPLTSVVRLQTVSVSHALTQPCYHAKCF